MARLAVSVLLVAAGVVSAQGLAPVPTDPDTFVQRLVDRISPDSIEARMRRLEAFRTRYSYTDSCRAAEQWEYDLFAELGLDSAELDSYPRGNQVWRNPVGTEVGTLHPDRIVIIGGHMDAISEDPENLAPGAEDNGSGAVMALEAARVLAGENLELTVKFVNFTGEELGLFGSAHYAQRLKQEGADVVGMLNFDMVAWPGGDWGVRLVGLRRAHRLVELQERMADEYTDLDHSTQYRSFPSDSRSFEEQGYLATSGYEYGHIPYPWYHNSGDTVGNLSMDLAAEVCRMAVAALVNVAMAPVVPEGFGLADVGTGTELLASWRPNTEPDLAGYKLLWGTDTFAYDDSMVLGTDTSAVLPGLTPGTRYHAAVVAFDSSGYQGMQSGEASAVPAEVPVAPGGLAAMPFMYGMSLDWRPNYELDVEGYNVYRTTVSGSGHELLNAGLVTDTCFADSGLMSDTMYYYAVSAVDTAGNESELSPEASGKPATLDHGVLLVDETRDGSGQPGSPDDAQQDAFYHALLHGFRYTDWDVAELGVPLAGDVGPYSTVFWHADEYGQQLADEAVAGLANLLSHGGRLFLTGWKPVAGMMGSSSYPFDFTPGQFPQDYVRIDRAEQSALVDFTGATGSHGYPDLELDSTKILGAMHGRLPYIDALLPGSADTILSFNSFSGDTFAGKPVGVCWLGGPCRTVMLGFPLYFCRDSSARALARKALEDLGEPYGIAEGKVPEAERPALVVFPNPAQAAARIRFALPRSGEVRIAVSDVTGRTVRELVSGRREAGLHSVAWDGTDSRGRRLGAGVYYCRLTTAGDCAVRRLVMAR